MILLCCNPRKKEAPMARMRFFTLVTAVIAAVTLFGPLSPARSGDFEERVLDRFRKPLAPSEPLLPEGVKVLSEFEPGEGPAIGIVERVQGQVYLLHKARDAAYEARKDQPLFTGDTLVTGSAAMFQARLEDRTSFALSEHTRLVLNKIVVDAIGNSRDSELELSFGKARFRALPADPKSRYEVKTPSAVAGVRASDFAMMVFPVVEGADLATALVTGEDTRVAFGGEAGSSRGTDSFSLSVVLPGEEATQAFVIGASVALGILNAIGPGLAFMRMPPWMVR